MNNAPKNHAPQRIYLAPPALGLGDLIVTLPVVQSLIRSGSETWLILRASAHIQLAERIPGLSGTVLEWHFDPRQLAPGDIYFDMRNHPLQTDYWWGSDTFSAAYPDYQINDILGHICRDLIIDADLNRLDALAFTRQTELADTVLFIPGSAFSFKCWPTDNWLALQAISKQKVAVVGEPENSQAVSDLIAAGLPWLPTPELGDALNAIASSLAVVAVDTGLMHLAVHQCVPTVALYRHNPIYRRQYSHVQAVIAGQACTPACYATERACAHNTRPQAGPGFTPRDWSCVSNTFRCMDSLSPELVLQKLQTALSFPNYSAGAPVLPAAQQSADALPKPYLHPLIERAQ